MSNAGLHDRLGECLCGQILIYHALGGVFVVWSVCLGALALLSGGAGVSSVVLFFCPWGHPARSRLLLFFCSVCVVVSVVASVFPLGRWRFFCLGRWRFRCLLSDVGVCVLLVAEPEFLIIWWQT